MAGEDEDHDHAHERGHDCSTALGVDEPRNEDQEAQEELAKRAFAISTRIAFPIICPTGLCCPKFCETGQAIASTIDART